MVSGVIIPSHGYTKYPNFRTINFQKNAVKDIVQAYKLFITNIADRKIAKKKLTCLTGTNHLNTIVSNLFYNLNFQYEAIIYLYSYPLQWSSR